MLGGRKEVGNREKGKKSECGGRERERERE